MISTRAEVDAASNTDHPVSSPNESVTKAARHEIEKTFKEWATPIFFLGRSRIKKRSIGVRYVNPIRALARIPAVAMANSGENASAE